MKHLFYTNSESAWKGLSLAIASAKKSVYFEMYIFVDDAKQQEDLIELLQQKAREGVVIKIVLDRLGSINLSGDAIDALRESGIELLFFNKLFRRLHRKIVVVDERIGFVGGVNIHDSARKWSDLFIRIEGSVIRSLIRSFARVYKSCGGEDEYLLRYKHKAPLGSTRIWFLEHLPSIMPPRLKDAYMEAMYQARHTILIVTPYFLPKRWLKKLLIESARYGIKVAVIVPARTDIGFITRANRYYMSVLAKEGVTFYLSSTMNHSKLLLIDNNLALVGSQNIDALSFDHNAEAGLFFDDEKMIADLQVIVQKWKSDATLFDPNIHVSFFDRLLSYLVRLLHPIL